MTRRRLILFTVNFPFHYKGGETMFVEPEVPHLAAAFATEGVTVAPLHESADPLLVPPQVLVDRSLAMSRRRWAWVSYFAAPLWPGFWPEVWRGLSEGGPIAAARVWRWAALAWVVWRWLQESVRVSDKVLLYTYWRGGATLAAARWVAQHAGSAVVTRVHRHELYEEAFTLPFQPWPSVYRDLACVIPVAQHGADYLVARGVLPERVLVSRLGVPAVGVRNRPSADGRLRLVSCSSMTGVKRVPFIAEAVVSFAQVNPDQEIEWVHFGDGPERPVVQERLRRPPPNLQVRLPGHVAHDEVVTHYAVQPVDLFVMLSASEGLPVSVQEALAAGIPVLATNVGGVAEAVPADAAHGILLPTDASITEVVHALRRLLIIVHPDQRNSRRDAAWQHWATFFDCAHNGARLARALHDEIN